MYHRIKLELMKALSSRDLIQHTDAFNFRWSRDPWGSKWIASELKKYYWTFRKPWKNRWNRTWKNPSLELKAKNVQRFWWLKVKKESVILSAEAEKQAAILRAEAKKSPGKALKVKTMAILKIQQATAQGLSMIKDVHADQSVPSP